ncbi:hypothetical protein FA15DRAFT_556051, partial [Coprinopsis marcescibilis]
VFCLTAHLVWMSTSREGARHWDFAAFSFATSLLTLLTIPAMYFMSVKRQGAFTSMIATEAIWCWVLWILWLASACVTSSLPWIAGYKSKLVSEAQAVQAFNILNFISFLVYAVSLAVISLICFVKGSRSVYTSSVRDFDFNA